MSTKHGGARPNSGRKKGQTIKRTQQIVAGALAAGISPLEFMLQVLRDETQTFEARFEAAKSAAPYVHPKLASVEHSADQNSRFAMTILTAVPEPDDIDMGANDDGISGTAH